MGQERWSLLMGPFLWKRPPESVLGSLQRQSIRIGDSCARFCRRLMISCWIGLEDFPGKLRSELRGPMSGLMNISESEWIEDCQATNLDSEDLSIEQAE
jgi:hypothetical protein